MTDHIVTQGNTWHVRLTIPEDIRAFFGNRKVLSKSLKTGSRAEAMKLRLPHLATWQMQFEAARKEKASRGDHWKEEAFELGKQIEQTITNEFVKSASHRKDPAIRSKHYIKAANASQLQGMLDQAIALRAETEKQIERGTSGLLKAANDYRKAGVPDHITDAINDLCHQVLSDEIDDSEFVREIYIAIGEAELFLRNQCLLLSQSEATEAFQIYRNPNSYQPKSPISTASIREFRSYLEHQHDNKKTIDQQVSRIEHLSEYLTKEAKELNFDTIHAFLNQISTSSSTKRNYIWAGNVYWKWAVRYSSEFRTQFRETPNPFENHSLPRNRGSQGESYVAFTPAQVKELYLKAKEKNSTLADIIAIAAYTGCRLEEIGRITTNDLIYDENQIIGLKINKAKTKAGERDVPIHNELSPLLTRLAATPQDEEYLFKGGKNKYGNRLDYISKQFGRLKKDEGFGINYAFHSFRATTITELYRADVDNIMIMFIVGHKTGTVTFDKYGKAGPSMAQRIKAINKLKFDLF